MDALPEHVPSLEELLISFRDDLLRILEHRASGLLRYESTEDIVHGVHLRALRVADRFEYRSDPEFRAWLLQIARQHIADRHAYWSARKRAATRMLRITAGNITASGAGVNPAAANTGPFTFAQRREQIVLATKALSLLLDRDEQLVRWSSEGLSTDEIAERLDITHGAAERAR
jgi:RNA polymerase sigma factor (sigma-70 family)